MTENRKMIWEEIDNIHSHQKASLLIQILQDYLVKYGPEVRIEKRQFRYDDGEYYTITYPRPENDSEYNKRIAYEAKWASEAEERERKEFERLRAKFGG